MKADPRLIALVPILGLSACASSGTPLIFGSTTTFGVTVNATPDTQGFDFTLGYKDKNLAIVPVAAIRDGNVQEILAWDKQCGDKRDAMSVFGQFSSKGDWALPGGTTSASDSAKRGHIKLDRFFATGLAATHLADGYRRGMANTPADDKSGCDKPATTANTNSKTEQPARPHNPEEGPRIRRLVYSQSNTLGIGISLQTSTSEQGPAFTLGYSGRDLALIPTLDWRANGESARLASRDQVGADGQPVEHPKDSRQVDAFSVLGQFTATSETQSINYGLGRFFSTGLAARKLAEGFEAAIEKQLEADSTTAANEPATGTKADGIAGQAR